MREIFNYEEYQEFLESKRVRIPRTNTPLDFITDEKLEELRKNNINDLKPYVPKIDKIDKHSDFCIQLWMKLINELPNDEFLKELDEDIKTLVSYNWYEQYGYSYA